MRYLGGPGAGEGVRIEVLGRSWGWGGGLELRYLGGPGAAEGRGRVRVLGRSWGWGGGG